MLPLLPPSGTGETNLDEAEALLKPYVEKFPNVSWPLKLCFAKMKPRFIDCICFLLVHRGPSCSSTPRGSLCSKATSHLWVLLTATTLADDVLLAAQLAATPAPLQAQETFLACIAAQQEWRQIHHLCYWELMWAYSFELRWKEAYRYADLLCKENKWSQVQQPAPALNCSRFSPMMPFWFAPILQAVYAFQKAAILSMLPEEEVTALGEDVVELFRWVTQNRCLLAKIHGGILETVERVLQAGGRSQDEDCRKIHSDGEVCSKEGAAVQFPQPHQATCPCSGEETPSHRLLLDNLLQHPTSVLRLHRKWCMSGMASPWSAKDPAWPKTFWPH